MKNTEHLIHKDILLKINNYIKIILFLNIINLIYLMIKEFVVIIMVVIIIYLIQIIKIILLLNQIKTRRLSILKLVQTNNLFYTQPYTKVNFLLKYFFVIIFKESQFTIRSYLLIKDKWAYYIKDKSLVAVSEYLNCSCIFNPS